MTQATLVDGLGQLHTRVYAAVADLPAPFLGAMAIVDGGTGGTLYVSLHDVSGTLAWIAFTVLYDAVVVNPSSTDNHIVQSTTGAFGLSIDSEGPGAAIQARGGYEALDVAQLDGATVPLVSGSRDSVVAGQPLLRLRPDTSTDTIQVNGYGEISCIAYSSLPTMTADHLGAIIRVLETGAQDKFYMGVLDATSTPIWTQFIGPAGATGATGATGAAGVTPELREFGGYIQVSYDDGVTWSNLVPLSDITGPAGTVSFPDLPGYGDSPVTFTMILIGRGTMLPYQFPVGYTLQVVGGDGYFVIHDPGQDYITPAEGSAVYNESNGFAIGRTLARFAQIDSGGLITGTQPTDLTTGFDALTVLTIEIENTLVELYANSASPGTQDSYILAEVTITAPAGAEWSHSIDLTLGNGSFVAYMDSGVPRGTWVSGVGWENNPSNAFPYALFIARQFSGSATMTALSVTFRYNATAGGSSSIGVATGAEFGGTNVISEAPITQAEGVIFTKTFSGSRAITAGDWMNIYFDLADGSSGGADAIEVIYLSASGTGPDPF